LKQRIVRNPQLIFFRIPKMEPHAFQSIDYSYLRPSRRYLRRKPDSKIISRDSDGNFLYRNIFYGVRIPADEKVKVIEFNTALVARDAKFPEWWSDHDTWRFLDAGKYNTDQTNKDFDVYTEYLSEMAAFRLDQDAADLISRGTIYITGRDRDGNPTLVINMKNADFDDKGLEALIKALKFIMAVMKKYMMLPHYCELFNVFVDFAGRGFWASPIAPMKRVISVLDENFKNSIHKIVLYNPSTSAYVVIKV
jgi:hypothetical protein